MGNKGHALCWNCGDGASGLYDDCGMMHCYNCNRLWDLNDYNDDHPVFKALKELYDKEGVDAVLATGKASHMPEGWCNDCECDSYSFDNVCIICWGTNIEDY